MDEVRKKIRDMMKIKTYTEDEEMEELMAGEDMEAAIWYIKGAMKIRKKIA